MTAKQRAEHLVGKYLIYIRLESTSDAKTSAIIAVSMMIDQCKDLNGFDLNYWELVLNEINKI